MILFFDACHSGKMWGSVAQRAPNITNLVNQLSDVEGGAIVFTSSTGRQFSLEKP